MEFMKFLPFKTIMDLSTAKYIMDYLYFSRADEPTFQYYKNVSQMNLSNQFCLVC